LADKTLGIIGKKLGMTQIFRENGTAQAVTAIEAGPCTVVRLKTKDKNGYNAAQLGFGQAKIAKSSQGKVKGDKLFATLREFRVDDIETVKAGQSIDVNLFKVG
jgi:large subunit ribosomal protein L3